MTTALNPLSERGFPKKRSEEKQSRKIERPNGPTTPPQAPPDGASGDVTVGMNAAAAGAPTAQRAVSGPVEGDPRHKAAMEQMQKGDWAKAAVMLRTLVNDYPDDNNLQLLVAEAEFKSEIDADWGETVKGRKLAISPIRVLAKLAVALAAVAFTVGGLYFYRNVVLPNQAATAEAVELQARVDEADYALQAGQYEKAIAYFESLLEDSPDNGEYQTGLDKARAQLALETEYQDAVELLDTGNIEDARLRLTALENKAPGYRDVQLRLAQISASGEVKKLFETAALAYEFNKWQQAAQLYDQIRQIESDFESELVTQRLIETSLLAGKAIVSEQPTSPTDLDEAQQLFRKVLTLDVSNATAKSESTLLSTFQAGQRALDLQSLEQAVAILEPLYLERPAYLNGYLAQILFDTYMALGDNFMLAGDRFEAFGFFSRAANLNGIDPGEAKLRLAGLEVLLTPTPTPTNTPTPAPIVPTATPAPMDMYTGWIGLKSNKEGGTGLFVMRPDGSDLRPVSSDSWEIFERIYAAESWSPDSTARVYPEKDKGTGTVNLFKFRHDLPENWDRRLRITDFPGDDYDPKWSPANDLIVFVSNHTGNDEIWTVRVDDETAHKQLTHNDWEWDKHPSWSPDGSQIIFFSNRSGSRQIWIMNADGSTQTQLSDGQYEYWDPIWIKPGYLAPPQ